MPQYLFHLPGDESAADRPVPPPPIQGSAIRGLVYAVIAELILIVACLVGAAAWFLKNWLGY